MTALFFSCVCDFCDGKVDDAKFDLGFVVWRGQSLPVQEYVFQSYDDAHVWRRAHGIPNCPILTVRAPVRFNWRQSTGSLQGIVTADRLVTIYPDHRFPPEPNRAYLAENV